MRLGFTYDLRDDYLREGYSAEEAAEFDELETIEAIDAALASLGHIVDRIGGVKKLSARLAAGDRWDLVFNYAEGMFGFAREAQVPALLDAFQIPYTFSDGLVFALTLHKAMTKHIVRSLGIPTPDFAVVSNRSDVAGVSVPFPVFVKPVAGGSSVGVSAASHAADAAALESACCRILDTYRQPALVETFLPGREVTVGIVGTGSRARVIGVMEVIFTPDAEAHGYSVREQEAREGSIRNRQRRGGRGGGRHRAACLERTRVSRPGPCGLPLRSSWPPSVSRGQSARRPASRARGHRDPGGSCRACRTAS